MCYNELTLAVGWVKNFFWPAMRFVYFCITFDMRNNFWGGLNYLKLSKSQSQTDALKQTTKAKLS